MHLIFGGGDTTTNYTDFLAAINAMDRSDVKTVFYVTIAASPDPLVNAIFILTHSQTWRASIDFRSIQFPVGGTRPTEAQFLADFPGAVKTVIANIAS